MPIQSRYLDEARRRVLIYDGAMGTQILNLALTADDYGGAQYDGCPEILVVSRPDAIRDIHRAYLAAGRRRAGDRHLHRHAPQAGRL